jgi:hypothetical protein
VPDVEFPRANDREAHAKSTIERHKKMYADAAKVMAPYLVGIVALAIGGGIIGGQLKRKLAWTLGGL